MIILLSPSKTLDCESPAPKGEATQPRLLSESQTLIKQLRGKSVAEIQQLMDISEKLATLNHQRFQQWSLPFTPQNARPCFYAFQGDVYTGLEAASFDKVSTRRAQERLRILSGLYGLLRPMDLIQPYRLEMGTRLATSRGKNLYDFWDDRITQMLNEDLATQKHKLVINLASEEYFSAVRPPLLKGKLITPIFKERKGNQLKIIGLFAKKARGMMARYLIKENIQTAEGIHSFAMDGYRYQPHLSTETAFIFMRGT